MRCETCGHVNEPGVKFCAKCGTPFAETQAQQPPAQAPYQAPQAPYQPPAQGVSPQGVPPQPQGQAPYQPPAQAVPPQQQYPQPGQQQYQQPYQQPGQAPYPPQGQYAPPIAPKQGVGAKIKSLPLKKILFIAIPVIVVIIAAIIIIPMLTGGGGSLLKHSITFFGDDEIIFISGDNNDKFKIDGDIHSYMKSIDGSKAVVLVDYDYNNGGTLWFITTSTCYKIADDVVDFQLSDTGNGVAYFTDYDARNDVATLFLYDTSSKNSTRITEDAYFDGDMMSVCISPNGKSIGYVSDFKSDKDEFTGYIKIDGKAPESLGKNTFAVAVSDGGRTVYFVKLADNMYNGALHVRSGRNENRLISDMYPGQSFMLNRDYSEVIFTVDDRSFISRGAGERERIGSIVVTSLIMPRGTPVAYSINYAGVLVYGVRNFNSFVAYTSEGLVHVDRKLDTNKISSSSDYGRYAQISTDGRTLLYRNNNGHLSAIDPTNANAERREVARNVISFVATSDAKSIYYINDDDELWFVKGNNAPVKISDDASYLVMPFNSARAFFLVDYSSNTGGELFCSNNGGKKVSIPRADEVRRVWVTAACVFYLNRDDEAYRSNGNENFVLFEQDVWHIG